MRATQNQITSLIASLLLAFWCFPIAAQNAAVWTAHNDNARTGLMLSETVLTPSSVDASNHSFGKLASVAVEGQVYAQPLYLPTGTYGEINLAHNTVFVVTEQNWIYAFNVDNPGQPLQYWARSLSGGRQPISCAQCVICPTIGITSTPVVDTTKGILYAVTGTTSTKCNAKDCWTIHALNISNGSEVNGGPKDIVPSNFVSSAEVQRASLLLLNGVGSGVVYVGFSSRAETGVGVIMAIDKATLTSKEVFRPTPTANTQGGIWMSGAGLAADSNNDMFVSIGNGYFDGITNWGDSVVRLSNCSVTNSCSVTDSFTPYDQCALASKDVDLGAGGVVILPDRISGSHQQEVVAAGRDGYIYIMDRQGLGRFVCGAGQLCSCKGLDTNVVQTLPDESTGRHGQVPYYSSAAYFKDSAGVAHLYAAPSGTLNNPPTKLTMYDYDTVGDSGHFTPGSATAPLFLFPGPTPSVSANQNQNGIVWAIERRDSSAISCPLSGSAATLYAFDASNVASTLYDSTVCKNRDSPGVTSGSTFYPGIASKFSVPTIANGNVFIGASNTLAGFGGELDVFGIYSGPVPACQ
jgi:hypothetical protein